MTPSKFWRAEGRARYTTREWRKAHLPPWLGKPKVSTETSESGLRGLRPRTHSAPGSLTSPGRGRGSPRQDGTGCPPSHAPVTAGSHLDLQGDQAHLAALVDQEALRQVDVLAPLLGEELHHELTVHVYLVPVEAEELLDQQLVASAVRHAGGPRENREAEKDGHGAAARWSAAPAARSSARLRRRHLQGPPRRAPPARCGPRHRSSSRRLHPPDRPGGAGGPQSRLRLLLLLLPAMGLGPAPHPHGAPSTAGVACSAGRGVSVAGAWCFPCLGGQWEEQPHTGALALVRAERGRVSRRGARGRCRCGGPGGALAASRPGAECAAGCAGQGGLGARAGTGPSHGGDGRGRVPCKLGRKPVGRGWNIPGCFGGWSSPDLCGGLVVEFSTRLPSELPFLSSGGARAAAPRFQLHPRMREVSRMEPIFFPS